MNNQPVYEIVVFKAQADVTTEQVLLSAQSIQSTLESYTGYISRDLIQADNDQWVDIVKWESLEDAQFAAEDIMSKPEAATFMTIIDTASINMMHGKLVFTTQANT